MLARKAEKQRETNIQVSMIPKELAKCIWFPGFGCRLPSRNHLSGTISCGPDIFRLRNMYKSHNIEYKSGDFRSTWMVTWKVFFRLVGTERNFRFRYPLGSYNIKRFHDLHLKVSFVTCLQHCTGPPGPNGVSKRGIFFYSLFFWKKTLRLGRWLSAKRAATKKKYMYL